MAHRFVAALVDDGKGAVADQILGVVLEVSDGLHFGWLGCAHQIFRVASGAGHLAPRGQRSGPLSDAVAFVRLRRASNRRASAGHRSRRDRKGRSVLHRHHSDTEFEERSGDWRRRRRAVMRRLTNTARRFHSLAERCSGSAVGVDQTRGS